MPIAPNLGFSLDGFRNVGRADQEVRGVRACGREGPDGFERVRKRFSRPGDFKLFAVDLEFYVIRISGGIVRARLVPVAPREGRGISVEYDHAAGEGVIRVVDDVVPGRVARNRGFGNDGGIYRSDVRLHGGFLRVRGIAGEGDESDRRQNREYRHDDDELGQRESSGLPFPGRFSCIHTKKAESVKIMIILTLSAFESIRPIR